MKQLKKILALTLALMLVLSLCACGQPSQNTNGSTTATTNPTSGNATTNPTEKATELTIPDGMAMYTVKVVDEEGNPVVGAMVQVCTDESCLVPAKTDDAGIATFGPAAEGAYHANFLPSVPEGYEADAEVFYFADGETELTIVLKAVSDGAAN